MMEDKRAMENPREQQKQIIEEECKSTFELLPYSFEKKTNKYNNNDHKKSIKNKIAKRRKK